jgi:hypothetical protein
VDVSEYEALAGLGEPSREGERVSGTLGAVDADDQRSDSDGRRHHETPTTAQGANSHRSSLDRKRASAATQRKARCWSARVASTSTSWST